jgi:hypothetical protein
MSTGIDIYSAPRGRTEDEWLDVADRLIASLAEVTGCSLEIGRYHGTGGFEEGASVSLGVRVRSKQGLPFVPSDYWEAAICVTADDRGTWADVFAFPFLRGSAVTPKGRIADQGPSAEIDRFWWFQYADQRWQSRGWTYPEGLGEWAWVKEPGDDYAASPMCRPTATMFHADAPILVDVELGDLRIGPPFCFRDADVGVARVSLLSVNRDRECTNIVPWSKRPLRSNSPHVQRFRHPNDSIGNAIRVGLDRWHIRRGWIPGKYSVRLRLQYKHHNSKDFLSVVSEPFKFMIVDS